MGYEEFHLKITRFHRQPPLQCGDSPTFRRQETHEIDPEDGDTLMAAWTMAIAACGEVHPQPVLMLRFPPWDNTNMYRIETTKELGTSTRQVWV